MVRPFSLPLIAITLMTAGCANSVANDPAYMARVRAEQAASTERWNRFWSSGSPGVATNYTTGTLPQRQPAGVQRCYQTSNNRQTCFR
jgi:uncharacterized protein YbaP (TraB family)